MKWSVSFAAFIVLVAFETRLCSTPEAAAWNYQPKSISFSKSTRVSRSHTSNSTNTFRIEINLFICGEISPSPGQERTRSKPKYICGECTRTARIPRRDIVRSHTGWSHAKCLQLSKSTFKYYLQHQEIEWTCYIKHQQCTKQITEIKERLVSNAFAILSVQETKIDRSFPNIQFHVNDYNLFL